MNKKYLIIFFLVICLFVSLFVFSKTKNNDITKNNTVVFWTLQLGTFDNYINRVINDFEKENPGIKIKWIDVPYSEGEKRTLAAILTDNPPDLVNLTPDFSLLLAQKNALYFINKDNLKQYLPSLTEPLKYKDNYFGVPFYATSAVTLYNKNLLKKINYKHLPKTYDDLFQYFPENKSFYITMISFSENDTLLKILNKYNINSPDSLLSNDSIRLFKEFKRIYDENIVPKESITQTHRDSLEKYMSGQLAFIVTGANFINMIKENAPSVYENTEILPQLTGKTGLYDYSLMNFVIPKKSHNKDAALKFALYFTNKQNQLEFSKLTSVLPVNQDTLKDDYFIKNIEGDIQTQARIISATQLNKLQPQLKYRNKKELNILSSDCIGQILINNANIKESLEKFYTSWVKLQ